jgi:hypothetical protein
MVAKSARVERFPFDIAPWRFAESGQGQKNIRGGHLISVAKHSL